MFEFIRALFNPPPPSGATAKERLRLVLLSDHLSLAPDVIEALKRDLLEVFSRYVEIDVEHADVTFEQRESEVAMLASVPITGVRDRKATAPPPVAPVPPRVLAQSIAAPPLAPEFEPVPVAAAGQPEITAEAPAAPATESDGAADAGAEVPQPVRSSNGRPPRRRRRKKTAAQNGAQGQVKVGQPGIAASQA